MSSFATRYRVDSVPPILRPLYTMITTSLGLLFYAYGRLMHWTCAINITGKEVIERDSNFIFCCWHTFSPVYFCTFPRHTRHAWMQHPAWLVRHVHVVVRLVGVEHIVYGSTGHGGREAADRIVEFLKRGYSTLIMPDGPRGPSQVAKDGALHIAKQSGVPIVAIRFRPSRYLIARGWDKKRWPLPFSTIGVELGDPIDVTALGFDAAMARLVEDLGVPD